MRVIKGWVEKVLTAAMLVGFYFGIRRFFGEGGLDSGFQGGVFVNICREEGR
jgi:hypothetical protein